MQGQVQTVSINPVHGFSKQPVPSIGCLQGLGVDGDAHCGETVRHRSRVAADPTQPNLRQVHLLAMELLDELNQQGFGLAPGSLGENITLSGLDLLSLPRDSRLRFTAGPCLRITGLRNPCAQIESFRTGLLRHVAVKDASGQLVRRAGVMAVVDAGGVIRPGDRCQVELPELPHHPLERV